MFHKTLGNMAGAASSMLKDTTLADYVKHKQIVYGLLADKVASDFQQLKDAVANKDMLESESTLVYKTTVHIQGHGCALVLCENGTYYMTDTTG